jgi:hypothetical protein
LGRLPSRGPANRFCAAQFPISSPPAPAYTLTPWTRDSVAGSWAALPEPCLSGGPRVSASLPPQPSSLPPLSLAIGPKPSAPSPTYLPPRSPPRRALCAYLVAADAVVDQPVDGGCPHPIMPVTALLPRQTQGTNAANAAHHRADSGDSSTEPSPDAEIRAARRGTVSSAGAAIRGPLPSAVRLYNPRNPTVAENAERER